MASHLRRTDDLQRLKTRELVLQNTDGSYPLANGIPYIENATGSVGVSDATVTSGGVLTATSATITGALTAASTQFSVTNTADVAIGGNLAIGLGSAVHALDVLGQVNIEGTLPPKQIFTTPGRYMLRIPSSATTMNIEMIGAGGNAPGGYGGYIKGTLDVSTYAGQTLTVQVGGAGSFTTTSTASFVSFLNAGPILAIAGAGGSGGSANPPASGGHGGGGAGRFTNIVAGGTVAIGTDGAPSPYYGTPGGQGGQAAGGGNGSTSSGPQPCFGPNGAGRPVLETYADVAGGAAPTCAVPGGNGYTGGGAAGIGQVNPGGGGGGSSFISTLLTLISSFRGDDAGYAAVLPGYGRSDQNGYVSIEYINTIPSLYASGDIVSGATVSGAGLQITTSAAPTNATDPGTPGQIEWDTNYIYVCVATNTWKRAGIATW